MRFKFEKKERLSGELLISNLFKKGNVLTKFPFQVRYILDESDSQTPVKILVSVPKRNIRSAVKRNKIKRLIREAYRKNKYIVYDFLNEEGKTMQIAIVYTGKTIPEYAEVEKKLILILQILTKTDGENSR